MNKAVTRYVLTLEPKPKTDEIHALRAVIKVLGRRFGLRVVNIRVIDKDCSKSVKA